MKVSFTGFKNAGMQINQINNENGEPRMWLSIFNCELTNDTFGKDLDAFRPVFNNNTSSDDSRKNFLNLQFWHYLRDSDREKYGDKFVINQKEYPVNMENMRIFQKLADLFKKVNGTPDYLFKCDKSYLESDNCVKSFILPPVLQNEDRLRAIHDVENIKSMSQYLVDEITNAVAEFLEV